MTDADGADDTHELTPVTIVGGYLGAGKTTLINHLLQANHGLRLAILVNDFGAINVDASLIASEDGNVVSMENGCVCCSIADALGDGLDEVLALDPPPDQIVVEASGVADPAKIAAYGAGWPGCRLDAVVVLADVETIIGRQTDQFVGELVQRQLRSADLVVLTKCDLVNPEQVERVRLDLEPKTDGPIVAGGQNAIDHEVLLDAGLSSQSGRPTSRRGYELAKGKDQPSGDSDGSGEADQIFKSIVIPVPEPVDLQSVRTAIAALPDAVIRLKGIIPVRDSAGSASADGSWAVVQRVGRRVNVELAPPALSTRSGFLVAIAIRGTIEQDLLLAVTNLQSPSR